MLTIWDQRKRNLKITIFHIDKELVHSCIHMYFAVGEISWLSQRHATVTTSEIVAANETTIEKKLFGLQDFQWIDKPEMCSYSTSG